MIDMTLFLIIMSSVLTTIGMVPYIVEVIRKKTKPRVVSWFVWSVLTAISCAAALSEGQIPTAILLFFSTVETALVVILGWRYGNREIGKLDIACLVGALVGIILWQLFDSPAVAIIAMITIDFLGGIPTLIHAWTKPHEETWVTFLLSSLGAFCTLLVVGSWRVTAFAFPLYLAGINALYAFIIIVRRKARKGVR